MGLNPHSLVEDVIIRSGRNLKKFEIPKRGLPTRFLISGLLKVWRCGITAGETNSLRLLTRAEDVDLLRLVSPSKHDTLDWCAVTVTPTPSVRQHLRIWNLSEPTPVAQR